MSPLSSFVTNSFDVRNLSVRPLRQKSLNPFTSRGGLVLSVHRLEGGERKGGRVVQDWRVGLSLWCVGRPAARQASITDRCQSACDLIDPVNLLADGGPSSQRSKELRPLQAREGSTRRRE